MARLRGLFQSILIAMAGLGSGSFGDLPGTPQPNEFKESKKLEWIPWPANMSHTAINNSQIAAAEQKWDQAYSYLNSLNDGQENSLGLVQRHNNLAVSAFYSGQPEVARSQIAKAIELAEKHAITSGEVNIIVKETVI
ncbi:MAG: hypothetical protein R2867_02420 [Caldilineaceae bacterium]